MFSFSGVGKVIKEVTVREVKETKLATFTIVSNRGIKKGDEWENVGTFIEVNAWGRLAETAEKLQNQDNVQVVGRLEQQTWVSKEDGEKKSKFVVEATNIEQIRPKKAKDEDKEGELVGAGTGDDTVPF